MGTPVKNIISTVTVSEPGAQEDLFWTNDGAQRISGGGVVVQYVTRTVFQTWLWCRAEKRLLDDGYLLLVYVTIQHTGHTVRVRVSIVSLFCTTDITTILLAIL